MRRALVAAFIAALLAAPAVTALTTSLKGTRVLSDGTQPGAVVLGVTGADILVAVLDTGVDDSHASLQGSYVTGVDVSNGIAAVAVNPGDTDGHGTHVANIILGRGAGATPRGVAPGAKLVDVKVASDVGSLSLGGLELGLEWVLSYNEDHPDAPIQVVSLSLATLTPGRQDDDVSDLIEDLTTQGVVVVAAAGNCGPKGDLTCRRGSDGITSPGSAPAAITVAALDDRATPDRSDDVVAPFSSRGPGGATEFVHRKPDVAAPGANITSARPGSGSATMNGTSQAAPHVSGIVALMLEAKPGITPAAVKQSLVATASHPNAWDAATGYGAVDAYEAVRHAKGPPYNVAPVASVTASATTVPVGTRVFFSGNASRDPDGLGVTYRWTLAGHPDATTPWTSYVLDQAGEASVKLTVTDADGAVHEAVAKVTVQAPPPPDTEEPPPEEDPEPPLPDEEDETAPDTTPPVARFTVTPRTPLVDEAVAFDARASADDRGVATFAWDFTGDGVADASGATVQRVFAAPGPVLVNLTVADAAGNLAYAEEAVIVSARPDESEAPDTAPPTVTITRPRPGDRLVSPVRAEWAVTDDVEVAQAILVLDGIKTLVAPLDAKDLDLALGAHTLRVEAKDASGKEGFAQVAFLVVAADVEDNATEEPGGEETAQNGTPGAGLVGVLVAAAAAVARRRR